MLDDTLADVCFIDSPPLAPAFAPSAAQMRFMRLHLLHVVEQWRWHWLDTMLRATTDRGVTATIWRDALDELVREGLMRRGLGFAMELTMKGREIAR